MLPYIEGGTIYNAINFSFAGGYGHGQEHQHHGLVHGRISSFMCPSDTKVNKGGPPDQTPGHGQRLGRQRHVSAEHQQLPRQHRHDDGGLRLGDPGYACCSPDPMNFGGVNGWPTASRPFSTGMFVYWICLRHPGRHRRHVEHRRLRRVAGRRRRQ